MASENADGRSSGQWLKTVLIGPTARYFYETVLRVEDSFESGKVSAPLSRADEHLVAMVYLGEVIYVLHRLAGEPPTALSPQQRHIGGSLLKGMPRKTIAHDLGICQGTVASHMARMCAKYRVAGTTELIKRLALFGGTELDGTQLSKIVRFQQQDVEVVDGVE